MPGPTLKEQLLRKCKHFTGIQHDACKEGVRYADVEDKDARPLRVPCFEPSLTTCEKRCMRTDEEAQAEADAIEKRILGQLKKMSSGVCPVCDHAVGAYRQSGSCVYAEPCGHRQGQGDAKAMNKALAQVKA